jgi:hypothetical protein
MKKFMAVVLSLPLGPAVSADTIEPAPKPAGSCHLETAALIASVIDQLSGQPCCARTPGRSLKLEKREPVTGAFLGVSGYY